MGYRELLRTQPAFRRLWLGQVVSEIGDWLQFVALVGLFPTRGAAAERLAGLFIVRLLPSILWAPLAGVVADRFARGRVMVACDLGRAAVVLAYLAVRGPEDTGWIYALMFVQESLTAFFEPARAASLPQVVPPRALLAAPVDALRRRADVLQLRPGVHVALDAAGESPGAQRQA